MPDKVVRKHEPHHLYGTAFSVGPSNHARQGQKRSSQKINTATYETQPHHGKQKEEESVLCRSVAE